MSSLKELSPHAWDAALEASGKSFRFSHRAAAGQALEAAYPSYHYSPCRVDYEDGVSLLFALVRVERRLRSLRMTLGMPLGLEGTPIALAGEPEPAHLKALFEALDSGGILHIHGGAGGSPPVVGVGEAISAVTHVLDLSPGYEAIWTGAFSGKTRNMCRKAKRSGLAVARESSAAAIAAYQALYRSSALGWGYSEGPYPEALFGALLSDEHAELWLARLDGEAIAGAVMLHGSADLLYWSGAMNRDFRHAAPSNAIIDAVVKSGCERGLAYLDFGASDGLGGVEAFKRSFGARPREYINLSLSSCTYRQLERALGLRSSLRRGRSSP